MKILQLLFIGLFFITASNAQKTAWGDYTLKKVPDDPQLMKVTFDLMNDVFYLKPGDKESDLVFGNKHIEVVYSVIQKGEIHLTKIVKGNEYLIQKAVTQQSKSGFKFVIDAAGLNQLMEKFVLLTDPIYHPSKYFKTGMNKEGTRISYLELLGNGKAYYGQHDLDGIFDGRGTYILMNHEKFWGIWKKGVQEGEFLITKKGSHRAEGSYTKGKQDGLWKLVFEDQKYQELVFENGIKVSEQIFFKPHNKSLKSGLDNGYVYESVCTESKKNGVWKDEFPFHKIYFRLFSNEHLFCFRSSIKNRKDEQHIGRLIKIEEEADKRTEYYNYTFLEGFGQSEPTITIYNKRQKAADGSEYNILFYFPHKSGERRYHFLRDEQTDKKDKEFRDNVKNFKKNIKSTLETLEKNPEKDRNY